MRFAPILLCLSALSSPAQETFPASPKLDAEIDQAVRDGLVPGAVLLVGHDGKIVHRKAYGNRALIPAREAMTLDTIFDIASLTKVVATTPAIMKLFEQGKVRPGDPVTVYLPEFQGGKSEITVRDLMTHFSGLRPDLDLQPAWSGYETGIEKALRDKPTSPPGQRFVYSDINFELLGEIVRRVSGKPLDQFVQEQIFAPLGMKETTFRPPMNLRGRIAPTEIDATTGKPFRGVVHDPTARNMGGVAGHAGLFTTAADLARYAQMWLDKGRPIFAPDTVAKFTQPASPPGQTAVRSLGWDLDSQYSSPRGTFPPGSYGHTGFTGTSLWIDPASNTYVILLTNAVHPKSGKNLSSLRRSIATIVASAVVTNRRVVSGLDVLEEENFAPLKGKRVGVITNQTGLDHMGRRNMDAMRQAGIKVTAVYSPEHGINGKLDQPNVDDSKDEATGLPVWSLYQNSRFRMTAEMLRGVDALVFDMQDAGARFYTYGCTMLAAMDRAAKGASGARIPFYVLDRPNPVTGFHVEGPMLDKDLESGIGCYSLPIRHGLTLGELATMANAERKIGADLHVVKMKNWAREEWFDRTGLAWVNPSPNLRSISAATLYPGVAMLESAPNLSVGRGTDAPFEQIGADWIQGPELAEFLNARAIPGVHVSATRFQPVESVFKGKNIEGVRFEIMDRESFDSVRFGLELAFALNRLYPGKIDFDRCKLSIGNRKTIDAMKAGAEPSAIEQAMANDLAAYMDRRKAFLLY